MPVAFPLTPSFLFHSTCLWGALPLTPLPSPLFNPSSIQQKLPSYLVLFWIYSTKYADPWMSSTIQWTSNYCVGAPCPIYFTVFHYLCSCFAIWIEFGGVHSIFKVLFKSERTITVRSCTSPLFLHHLHKTHHLYFER